MSQNKKKTNWISVIVICIIFYIIFTNIIIPSVSSMIHSFFNGGEPNYSYSDKVFSIISSSENKILDNNIKSFAKKKGYKIEITYTDTLDVIDELNSGKKYDAIFLSNSIWLRMLNSSVYTSNLRSTSITPVIFGIKKSKAEKLGFVNKKVYTKDILNKINSGELTFSMANPVTTNSGASAYLEILSNLAGNPEVLTSSHLQSSSLKKELKKFFTGIKRTSGDEDFLETSFVNGDYDAAFTYESSIININKQLEKSGKETLYAIYPVDGVAISDSPFVYIDNKNENKKEIFENIQEYLLSDDGQKVLLNNGRRTWYGGINKNAPKDVFNPKWGINTSEYLVPIKYPSISVIREALDLYQTEFRKPVHVVFCLDYSGSMYGSGIEELRNAMEYVLTSTDSNIKFTDKDKIDVIPFGTNIIDEWSTSSGLTREQILNKINNTNLNGATALYLAAEEAIEILSKENNSEYVSSVILMTDGQANIGSFQEFRRAYKSLNKEIPVYGITFGDASERELLEISELTNGKVFDGRTDLTEAFKKVRGYN